MNTGADQVTQLYLFSFKTNKLWAFKQMGIGYAQLKETPGLSFFRLLGTGGGAGFSLRPDFSTYAFLGVWKDAKAAVQFKEEHDFLQQYFTKASSIRLLTLSNIKSHGLWGGQNPFQSPKALNVENKKIAIITRATLRWSRLLSFWRAVPKASKAIEAARGVYFYKGIGEWPFIQQATISLWDSMENVLQFAYKSADHGSIVKETRQKRWYTEDLFSRFYVEQDEQLKG
ncbi:MAG: DUF3291 domain-containing protein [Flavobacteriaceae bacterium]|nr:DUF3291 domain-containing protein [Flavobacteriaceae bacterium]